MCFVAIKNPSTRTSSFRTLFGPNKAHPYFQWDHDHDWSMPQRRFRAKTALGLAELSMLMYVKEAAWVEKCAMEGGLELVSLFEKDGIRAAHLRQEAGSILCFRGTEIDSLDNLVTDVKVRLSAWSRGGRVHKGFLKAWECARPWIHGEINKAGTSHVSFTGHSLGGALALLAAEESARTHSQVYSFGSPKVGDQSFVKIQKVPHFRVVNNTDLVPMAPPGGIYRHGGRCKWLTVDGRIQTKVPTSSKIHGHLKGHLEHAMEVFEAWRTGNAKVIPNANLVDHSPTLYVKKLIMAAGI